MRGRVLVIAGSDSGGGAGIQADLKTVAALGGYATTAVTALTAQDTTGVHGILPVPPDFFRLQYDRVLADLGADAIKTGMLGEPAMTEAVAERLRARDPAIPVVVDPVMVAKGGQALLSEDAVEVLRQRLLPLATVLTPNLPEAAVLCGFAVADEADMRRAGDHLLRLGAGAVLVKGGHMRGHRLVDLLVTPRGATRFAGERIETRHTHGTGCTLGSAVAVGLAQGLELVEAVDRARRYVAAAIRAAPGFGRGAGPLGHAVSVA